MFYAYEKAEYPAALGVVTVLLKVFFGVPALLAGWGIIGLGAVSLIVNCITFIVLYVLLVRLIIKPRYENDPALRRGMLRESFPLALHGGLLVAGRFSAILTDSFSPYTSNS